MPDYKNGKIYKIWSPEGDDIYIGATIQPLYKRFYAHKTKLECSSKLLFQKYNDVRIELIECCPCDNKEQLTKREGEHIRNTNCINKIIVNRTKKEYREDNKDKISERYKEYRENNKEKISERHKEYHKNNKDKILEQKKEYYENNKEKIKEYYENNKDKIKEQKSRQYTCECGRTFRISGKAEHERSLIHCNWVKFSGKFISDPTIP